MGLQRVEHNLATEHVLNEQTSGQLEVKLEEKKRF